MSQAEPLPPGWQEQRDDNNQIYYKNNFTNAVQWERPLPIPLLPLDTTLFPLGATLLPLDTTLPPGTYDADLMRTKREEAITLFDELLQSVFSTRKDMHTRMAHPQEISKELQEKLLSFLKNSYFFYTLRDSNNLTILGYIILTNKTIMMENYIKYLNTEMARDHLLMSRQIKQVVGDRFNRELEFILTHRVNDVDPDIMRMLTGDIIGQLFPSFTLSPRNVELLGNLMLTKIPALKLQDKREIFVIPHKYIVNPQSLPISRGGKLEKKHKLSRRNKLYKRKGSRKHYSRRHRGVN